MRLTATDAPQAELIADAQDKTAVFIGRLNGNAHVDVVAILLETLIQFAVLEPDRILDVLVGDSLRTTTDGEREFRLCPVI